jgi:hypothetical protein
MSDVQLKQGDIVVLKSDTDYEVKMTFGTFDVNGNAICYYVARDPLEKIKKVHINPKALSVLSS